MGFLSRWPLAAGLESYRHTARINVAGWSRERETRFVAHAGAWKLIRLIRGKVMTELEQYNKTRTRWTRTEGKGTFGG